jgi:hypothetical protein
MAEGESPFLGDRRGDGGDGRVCVALRFLASGAASVT